MDIEGRSAPDAYGVDRGQAGWVVGRPITHRSECTECYEGWAGPLEERQAFENGHTAETGHSRWWRVEYEPSTDRQRVLTHLAAAMGAVLRRALQNHLEEHGCGAGDINDPRYIGGFFNCPEAKRLWDLKPRDDQICLA